MSMKPSSKHTSAVKCEVPKSNQLFQIHRGHLLGLISPEEHRPSSHETGMSQASTLRTSRSAGAIELVFRNQTRSLPSTRSMVCSP